MKHIKSLLTEFNRLDSEVRKIFADFFFNENPLLMITETHWRPNTDVYETSKGIIVKMEIAGVKQNDIDITYENGKLIVRGRRPDYSVPDRVQCKQIEINYGEFERVITFERSIDRSIDTDNIKATYKEGMLFIFIPFLKKITPEQRIKIKIEEE